MDRKNLWKKNIRSKIGKTILDHTFGCVNCNSEDARS